MKKHLTLAENRDIFDKIKFRTKFEVAHAVWNPKISLIALGSRDGEVVVKRYLWKTGWKRNFSRDGPAKQFDLSVDTFPAPSSSKAKDQLLFLCWSPDGQVLLTVFQSGFCYFLDTQTGDTLFVKRLSYSPFCVQWVKFRPTKSLKFPRAGDLTLFSSSNFPFNESDVFAKSPQTVCCAVGHFYRHILHQSLGASFLCVLHSTATDTFVDIFSAGVLLIRRFSLGGDFLSLSNRQNEFFANDGKFQILSKDSADSFDILQLPGEIGQEHLLVYDQLVDCFCWMSFCCFCMQETFHRSVNNWKQSCQAFHQRMFAVLANGGGHEQPKKTKHLELCRDLLYLLQEEEGEASELVEKFLGSPTTQKELKQAGNFVDEYSVLIKGITHSLQPTTKALRDSICLLRSLLVKLTELNESRECGSISERLLDTLLRIAADHPIFDPYELLDKNCQRILGDFEGSMVHLDEQLLKALKLAEQNKTELDNLIRWLMALIYESGNDCAMSVDENIDMKLIGNFLADVVAQNIGQETTDDCFLDRIACHLLNENETEDNLSSDRSLAEENGGGNDENSPAGTNGAKSNWTLWEQMKKCLGHFQTLSSDGIHPFFPFGFSSSLPSIRVRPPTNQSKCIALSSDQKEAVNQHIGLQTEEEDEEETTDEGEMSGGDEEDEESGHGRRRRGPISLRSFIYGHSDQTTTTTEEQMECG